LGGLREFVNVSEKTTATQRKRKRRAVYYNGLRNFQRSGDLFNASENFATPRRDLERAGELFNVLTKTLPFGRIFHRAGRTAMLQGSGRIDLVG
jgi:hypothetical protein